MRDTQTLLDVIVALPGIAALVWLWRIVVTNEKRRRHDRDLIARSSRRVNSHERSIAKIEGREPQLLHPLYDQDDEEEEPFD
jgi:hypothetical protein